MTTARSYLALPVAVCAMVVTAVAPAAAGPHANASHGKPRQPKTLCVGHGKGCVSDLKKALAKAHDGDTIEIGRGTFAGGVTIRKSVHLVGAGRGRTSIKGGGPVITIKAPNRPEPKGYVLRVSISALTVRGGTATGNGYLSHGGGIYIPAGPDGQFGASVTLRHVTVTHNRATATTASPSPTDINCPNGFCPYAEADGGGIYNTGNLILIHSKVSDNKLNGALSHAYGAGIFSEMGGLTVIASRITGNLAEPKVFGRYAEGGGMYVAAGLTVRRSVVSGNRVNLETPFPMEAGRGPIDLYAQAGGIAMGNGEVSDTTIANNKVSAIDKAGEPFVDAAALMATGRAHLSNLTIQNNSVKAKVATTDGPAGSAVYLLAYGGPSTMTDSEVLGNTTRITSPHRTAWATGGVSFFSPGSDGVQATLSNVTIAHNSALAISATGTAMVTGAGIQNTSVISLHRVRVRGNVGTARGPSTSAQGGGIWDFGTASGQQVTVAMHHSQITDNTLTAAPGGSARGGGVYTNAHISRDHSTIAANHPDQCVGMGC